MTMTTTQYGATTSVTERFDASHSTPDYPPVFEDFDRHKGTGARLWFHDGASREPDPFSALVDPPIHPLERQKAIVHYHKLRYAKVAGRIDALKESCRQHVLAQKTQNTNFQIDYRITDELEKLVPVRDKMKKELDKAEIERQRLEPKQNVKWIEHEIKSRMELENELRKIENM
jgi:hypothetical protein